MGPLPPSKHHVSTHLRRQISRWPEAFPLSDISAYRQNHYVTVGISLWHTGNNNSDRGRQFDSHLFTELTRLFSTEAKSAVAAHEDCSRFPLKPTSWFQPQTMQEDCQPLSLKFMSRPLHTHPRPQRVKTHVPYIKMDSCICAQRRSINDLLWRHNAAVGGSDKY